MSAVRLWLKNRMAVCQLVVTCVFSVVCALTDPTGVTVPAVFGSMGTVVVVANLFGLVLAMLYSVGLSRAEPDVEYRSSRPVGWWDAALGVIIVLLMIPGLWGGRSSASVVRDVPVLMGLTMLASRWVPRALASLPAIGFFFVCLLAGRQTEGADAWWNWVVADPSGTVSLGWAGTSMVLGLLAMGLPRRGTAPQA